MSDQIAMNQRMVRAQQVRQPGVQYKLRVIAGTGGLLELVEQPPQAKGWFAEYARVMQFSGRIM